MDAKDTYGRTPLLIVCLSVTTPEHESLAIEIAQTLLHQGADINTYDNVGFLYFF